jgi:hypothetical protein
VKLSDLLIGKSEYGINSILEKMGIQLFEFSENGDKRGILRYFEFPDSFNLEIKRYFFISDMPVGELRGNHAHKTCYQLMHCIGPQVELKLESPENHITLTLDTTKGLILIPPRIWVTFKGLNPNSILAVFASELYDESDYINDYNLFMKMNQAND